MSQTILVRSQQRQRMPRDSLRRRQILAGSRGVSRGGSSVGAAIAAVIGTEKRRRTGRPVVLRDEQADQAAAIARQVQRSATGEPLRFNLRQSHRCKASSPVTASC